jgi:hypothetical protein
MQKTLGCFSHHKRNVRQSSTPARSRNRRITTSRYGICSATWFVMDIVHYEQLVDRENCRMRIYSSSAPLIASWCDNPKPEQTSDTQIHTDAIKKVAWRTQDGKLRVDYLSQRGTSLEHFVGSWWASVTSDQRLTRRRTDGRFLSLFSLREPAFLFFLSHIFSTTNYYRQNDYVGLRTIKCLVCTVTSSRIAKLRW